VNEALTVAEVLRKAADLIEPEGKWTRRAFSRNANGVAEDGCDRWSANPVCFCALGAIAQAAGMESPDGVWITPAARALEALISPDLSVAGWNDAPERTQAEVVAALRKAADLATEEGSRDLSSVGEAAEPSGENATEPTPSTNNTSQKEGA
jgi:hypothetical protein